MNPSDFDLALDQALQLRASGLDLEACLARFPQHAQALRPLLETADLASNGLAAAMPLPTPDLARGRARLMAAAGGGRRSAPTPAWRWAAAAFVAISLVLASGAISTRALPGDLLYPVKRALEDAQLTMAPDPDARATLRAELNTRRQNEVETLGTLGREAVVAFEGRVEDSTRSGLVVDGIRIEGTHSAEVGERVSVRVRVTATGVILEELIRIEPPRPTASPEPTVPPVTRRPTTSALPTATRTEQPATGTAVPTRKPSATPIPATERTTETPTAMDPTAVPARPSATLDQPTTLPRPTEPPTPTPGGRRP